MIICHAHPVPQPPVSRESGHPGMVESARTGQDAQGHRVGITGARWSLAGAEAVLKLRALISNGDFDAYFTWHLKQEHHRVHKVRYQDIHGLAA